MYSRNDEKRCEAAKKLKEQLKKELEEKEAIKKQETIFHPSSLNLQRNFAFCL